MAALTTGATPYSDGLEVNFGGGPAREPPPPSPEVTQKKTKSPAGFIVSLLTSNRSLFIFSEENFIRRCAKWLTEWLYPLLHSFLYIFIYFKSYILTNLAVWFNDGRILFHNAWQNDLIVLKGGELFKFLSFTT